MIVSSQEIRGKIDQLQLSSQGYTRQLERAETSGMSDERQARLKSDLHLAGEEIATLQKIASLWRVEPDPHRIEEIVRERLSELRARAQAGPLMSKQTEAESDAASGEVRALVWMLGEDMLTMAMLEMVRGREHADPSHTERAMPRILIHQLEEAPDADTRASAAYDLGKLHINEAIAPLAGALSEGGSVAEMALRSLRLFTPEELEAAGLAPEEIALITEARPSS